MRSSKSNVTGLNEDPTVVSALRADEALYAAEASSVEFDERMMHVELTDGRTISTPIEWYPRLFNATPAQRSQWELSGGGYALHWEEIDEDLSVRGMLLGRRGVEGGPITSSIEADGFGGAKGVITVNGWPSQPSEKDG